MNRWLGLGLILITAVAWALRGPDLAQRPMHNDEAVNAIKIQGLWENGRYAYDPNEHHGPTLFYFTLPFVWLSGAPDFEHLSESTLRAVSVFFGLLLILLLWPMGRSLGAAACLLAATLTAISPAMVFYSRYFIHEMLLVVFCWLVILSGWQYAQTRRVYWAVLVGVGLGLMDATKETFVLSVAAMVGALILTRLWPRPVEEEVPPESWWNWTHAALALAVCLGVAMLFFTSFFTNARGPLDSIRTYAPWLKRAGGASPHIHPWFFYLERLVAFQEARGPLWSEGLVVLLAMVGGGAALWRSRLPGMSIRLVRFLAFYTVLLTLAYSLISYKTPWCLLGFLHGLILLAGVGTVVLIRACRTPSLRWATAMALILAGAHLGYQAWRASFPMAADRRNPYVYAQTVPDVRRLATKVTDLARLHPDGPRMVVKVMVPDSDYWPLPWYLRGLKQVGWWGRLPQDPFAPVMIVGAKAHAALDDKSDKAWLMVGYFELRPTVFLELYVKFDLWEKYVMSLPRPKDE